MAIYRTTIGLGWGIRGRVTSGIRTRADRLGLELEPFPFVKLHELVALVPITVCGDADAVRQFAEYMDSIGFMGGVISEET